MVGPVTHIGTLYRFKLRMFLGPIRHQPVAMVGFALLALFVLPGAFLWGYFLPEMLSVTGGNLLELASLALAVLAAFFVLSAPGGGLLLQQAEVDFVSLAPLTVREFVLADLLFQLTFFGAGLPVVLLGALGLSLRLGAPPWSLLAPLATFAVFAAVWISLVQTLGIARAVGKRWAFPATGAIAAGLLGPAALRFAFRLPVAYADLPLPTTAAVEVALFPFGYGTWIGLPILALYAVVVVAGYMWATNRPSLPNLRGTFAFSFGLERRRRQQEALLRAFGRLRPAAGARLYRTRVESTMAVLHFVRMTRDGTLILSAVIATVFVVPFLGLGGAFPVGGVYLAFLLPVIAVGQWMVTDRSNLWIVLVSGQPPQTFFVGWWASLGGFVACVAGPLSLVVDLAVGRLDGVAFLASISAALGSTTGAVVCAARFPYAPNELSFRPFVHLLLAGLGGGLGAAPAFAIDFLLGRSPLAAALAGIAAFVVVAYIGVAIVARTTLRPAV